MSVNNVCNIRNIKVIVYNIGIFFIFIDLEIFNCINVNYKLNKILKYLFYIMF